MSSQDDRYKQAVQMFGASLDRLARAYEADPDRRRDLLQDVHLAIWRSFGGFAGRCSMRTWVYRVAHNTAASHLIRQRRDNSRALLSLEEIDAMPDQKNHQHCVEERLALDRLFQMIHRLRPLDRQLMLLYLEDLDSPEIGDITGLSAGNVRTQIHRIKQILARRFHEGGVL